jgi:hypothetical protein
VAALPSFVVPTMVRVLTSAAAPSGDAVMRHITVKILENCLTQGGEFGSKFATPVGLGEAEGCGCGGAVGGAVDSRGFLEILSRGVLVCVFGGGGVVVTCSRLPVSPHPVTPLYLFPFHAHYLPPLPHSTPHASTGDRGAGSGRLSARAVRGLPQHLRGGPGANSSHSPRFVIGATSLCLPPQPHPVSLPLSSPGGALVKAGRGEGAGSPCVSVTGTPLRALANTPASPVPPPPIPTLTHAPPRLHDPGPHALQDCRGADSGFVEDWASVNACGRCLRECGCAPCHQHAAPRLRGSVGVPFLVRVTLRNRAPTPTPLPHLPLSHAIRRAVSLCCAALALRCVFIECFTGTLARAF